MIGEIIVGDGDVNGGSDAAGDGAREHGGTLRVPQDYPTIQAAVNAAKPGSLVLVSPGVYKEAVTVTTANIVIRGLDRTGTVLEGGFVPRQRHQSARERGRDREHDRPRLYEQRFLLDGGDGLPRLVSRRHP